MRDIYNGIDLSVMEETLRFDAETVLDDSGTDYLYTRYTRVARTMVNGQVDVFRGYFVGNQWFRNGPAVTYAAQSSLSSPRMPTARDARVSDPIQPVRLPSGTPNVPGGTGFVAAVGQQYVEVVPIPNAPPLTMQAIRQRLTAPRGRLFIGQAGVELPNGAVQYILPFQLQSPSPDAICDCKNGPFPRILSIDQVYGDDITYVVTFAIETYVNEMRENGISTAGPLLSNRFSQTATVDDRSYTTISTEGRALFRTDYLYTQGTSPDELRALFMLKIPQGFKRENIVVTGLPDATGVAYRFDDRQVEVNFPAGPYVRAAKIAAIHRQAIINNSDVLGGALSAYERVLGLAANSSIANSDKTPVTGAAKKVIPYSPKPGP